MPLTRSFKDTIHARVSEDHEFRDALLREGIECLLSGDTETGKSILRDYINATVGFAELSNLTAKSPKSLMRMFSPQGNPQAQNLFSIIHHLQHKAGIKLEVHTVQQS